jgi:hypothetical protein
VNWHKGCQYTQVTNRDQTTGKEKEEKKRKDKWEQQTPSHLNKRYNSQTTTSDLNGLAVIGDASIDRKMSIHKPHLVAKSLGNTSDEILNLTESSSDGGRDFPGSKPSIDLQLLLSILIGDEIKIKVKMLEITNKLAARTFNFDHLGVNLDANAVRDVHGFGRKDDLHFFCNVGKIEQIVISG